MKSVQINVSEALLSASSRLHRQWRATVPYLNARNSTSNKTNGFVSYYIFLFIIFMFFHLTDLTWTNVLQYIKISPKNLFCPFFRNSTQSVVHNSNLTEYIKESLWLQKRCALEYLFHVILILKRLVCAFMRNDSQQRNLECSYHYKC